MSIKSVLIGVSSTQLSDYLSLRSGIILSLVQSVTCQAPRVSLCHINSFLCDAPVYARGLLALDRIILLETRTLLAKTFGGTADDSLRPLARLLRPPMFNRGIASQISKRQTVQL